MTLRQGLLIGVVFLLIALAALACTSNSSEPESTPTIADDAGTRAAAESALLLLSDFPEGWEEQPPDPDDDDDALDVSNAPQRCQGFFQEEELAGTVFEIEINEFHGPDAETIESRVTVFESMDSAADGFDEVRRVYQECGEPIRDALLDYFEAISQEASTGVTVVDFSMESIEFPRYGNETLTTRFVFHLELDGEPFVISYADIIAIRQGALVGEFAFQTLNDPPDPDLAQHLAELIEPRLASAWDSITTPTEDQ